MFLTPALAAAECANPGPPVHAYDAPDIDDGTGRPSLDVTPSELAKEQKKVPFRVMSTTVRQAFGGHVLRWNRKVRGQRCSRARQEGRIE